MIDPRWPNLRLAPDEDGVKLPVAMFQVTALVGYGWNPAEPNNGCYTRKLQTRRFAEAQYAVAWIENLHRLPSHHALVAVHRTPCDWRAVDLAELPDPVRNDPSEEDWT